MDFFETVRTNDFVEYFVFSSNEKFGSGNKIDEIYDSLISFAPSVIKGYIWHKEEFRISKVISSNAGDQSCYLHGILHYGDNIEDEWVLVYLFVLFSKQRNDIFVKLTDSDGEFLLIEASNLLPNWLQSETCNFQTYIYEGVVKLVPGKFSTRIDDVSKVERCLKRSANLFEVEKNITRVIEKKTERFANGSTEFLHQTRLCIPAKVAALLNTKPSLIASAVTAYCERDVIDKKICKTMRHFPPEHLVMRSVKFTKFLYAMISHEKTDSENKRSSWILPSSTEPNFKERVLGFKITCGFEILASKCKNNSELDLSLNKKWLQYVNVLQRKGYFKDFVPGSKDYTNLENQARNFFLENTDAVKSDSNCVLNVLQTINYDYDIMKKEESCLPPSDDEQWMTVNEETFDTFLRERFDYSNTVSPNSSGVVSSALNTFLNQFSDIEGVEIPQKNVDLNCMDLDADNLLRGISFDANSFLPSVEKMFDKMTIRNEIDVFDETSTTSSDLESDDGTADTDDGDSNASEEIDMKSYMQLMDNELENISVRGKEMSNVKEVNPRNIDDLNSNILANIFKSYEEQYGGSGPAGNLLNSLGLRLKIKKED